MRWYNLCGCLAMTRHEGVLQATSEDHGRYLRGRLAGLGYKKVCPPPNLTLVASEIPNVSSLVLEAPTASSKSKPTKRSRRDAGTRTSLTSSWIFGGSTWNNQCSRLSSIDILILQNDGLTAIFYVEGVLQQNHRH